MVKKVKGKSNAKKAAAAPQATARRSATSMKAASKYDQPGAPWWKKVAPPMPK